MSILQTNIQSNNDSQPDIFDINPKFYTTSKDPLVTTEKFDKNVPNGVNSSDILQKPISLKIVDAPKQLNITNKSTAIAVITNKASTISVITNKQTANISQGLTPSQDSSTFISSKEFSNEGFIKFLSLKIENTKSETNTKTNSSRDINPEIMKKCSHKTHHCRNSGYQYEMPIKYFFKNPDDFNSKEYVQCAWCREYEFTRHKKHLTKLKHQNNESKLNGSEFLICISTYHGQTDSKFPRESVPQEYFMKDSDDPNSKTYLVCIDCRKYKIFEDTRRTNKKRLQAEANDMILCVACQKEKIPNEMATNVDRTQSAFCLNCKDKSRQYVSARPKKYNNLKLEYAINMGSCCDKCHVIILKGSEDIPIKGLPLTFLYIKEIDDEKWIIYQNQEYLTKDFMRLYSSIIEVGVLEFDHLPENELRKRGMLLPHELYAKKQCNVCDAPNKTVMLEQLKQCVLLCKECHLTETIRRENPNKPKPSEKLIVTNSMKLQGCEFCGYKNPDLPRFFDFDHIDPSIKLENISFMVRNNYSMEELLAEIAKCRILCKNCHYIHTQNQLADGIINNLRRIDGRHPSTKHMMT